MVILKAAKLTMKLTHLFVGYLKGSLFWPHHLSVLNDDMISHIISKCYQTELAY